jgi:hypothetical protein
MRIAALFAIVACLQLVLPPRILAQAVPVNLDLSSTNRDVTASGGGSGLSISVGGTPVPINAGDLITAAEHTALQQVIMTGQQSIQLSALGHAIGGTVNLSNHMAEAISNLVVPNGVTAVHDFSTNELMNILGNLNNSGNFYAYSSNPQVNTGTINALNIFNNHGATLSSVLPSYLGLSSAVSEFNLRCARHS